MLKSTGACALAFGTVGLAIGPLAVVPPGQAVFSVSVDRQVTSGEPIVVDVIVSNPFADSLVLDLGWNRIGNFELILRSGSGQREVARPRETRPMGGVFILGRLELAPASRPHEYFIILREWLETAEPGEYTLEVRFLGSARTRAGVIPDIPGRQSLREIRILPRDEQQLVRRCSSLADEAIRATRSQDMLRAVRALSFVRDAAAVPSLLRVAEADKAVYLAIAGLVRVGGAEARSALLTLAQSPNPETARLAKGALNRIK
jgi:hypothetical protein